MSVESFGKYRVVERIGEGGFGTVYKGRDPNLKRLVAIKTLTTPDPELRERFLREAEIAAGLQHPNITTVHDFGSEGGRSYLVQEYLAGEDLDRIIARREPVRQEERLDWLIQLADALAYAHGREIVHRDVKPANVRVLEDGRIKLMDFGIAKLLSAEDQLTRTGMAMGTAGYLPPEQLRGLAVDRRADIFSFGVLAYELLCYCRPFAGESLSAVLYSIAHEPHPPLAASWPDCPPRLAAVIDRCLAKDPADRYPDLAPVRDELRAVRSAVAGVGAPAGILAGSQAPTLRPAAAGEGAGRPPAVGVPSPGGAGLLRDTYRSFAHLPRRTRLWSALAVTAVAVLALAPWMLVTGDGGDGSGAVAGQAAASAAPSAGGSGAVAGLPRPAPGGAGAVAPFPGDRVPPRPAQPPAAATPVPGPVRPAGAARFLVAVAGEPPSAAATASAALLRELAAHGQDAISPAAARNELAGGDPGRIAAAGRRHGATVVVVATFQGEAQPSVGRFFTGRAFLDLRSYDAATGRLLGSSLAEVGIGGGRGELAPSELSALTQAATEVGRKAADEVLAMSVGEGRSER